MWPEACCRHSPTLATDCVSMQSMADMKMSSRKPGSTPPSPAYTFGHRGNGGPQMLKDDILLHTGSAQASQASALLSHKLFAFASKCIISRRYLASAHASARVNTPALSRDTPCQLGSAGRCERVCRFFGISCSFQFPLSPSSLARPILNRWDNYT